MTGLVRAPLAVLWALAVKQRWTLLWLVAVLCIHPEREWVTTNVVVQLAIFLPMACVPTLLTGKMFYVDMAWPWGLVALGVQGFLTAPPPASPVWLISVAHILHGGRMALGASALILSGTWKEELKRYQYQHLRWKQEGLPDADHHIHMQADVLTQALANMTILSFPLLATLASGRYHRESGAPEATSPLAWFGVAVWGLAFAGKHPNYFCEWMVWNALVLVAIPSLPYIRWAVGDPLYAHVADAAMMLMVPLGMYYCLVHWTGANPAEYFSALKRPAYSEYQRSTP
eukprot:gene10734-290_t